MGQMSSSNAERRLPAEACSVDGIRSPGQGDCPGCRWQMNRHSRQKWWVARQREAPDCSVLQFGSRHVATSLLLGERMMTMTDQVHCDGV